MNRDEDDTLDEALPLVPLNGTQRAFPPWPQRLLNQVLALTETVRDLATYVKQIQAPSQRNATATVVMLVAIAVFLCWIGVELHLLRAR